MSEGRAAPAFDPADHAFMARALVLARRGLYTTDPNPRVGCVLVRDGEVVGEGWHVRAGGPHAEIAALRAAGERAGGATAYVTLEPCRHHGRTGPCTDALIAARVGRVVAAMRDPNPRVAGAGLAQLEAAGIRVAAGLEQAAARALNIGFVKRMTEGRPWVRLKLAMSLDGRTAMASGESRWITGPEARRDVHRLRARSAAVLTGIGTLLADDPALTARDLPDGIEVSQPLRVIVDSTLRTPPAARILQQPGATLIVTSQVAGRRADRLRAAGAELLAVPGDASTVDLDALLAALAAREINEVLVEAGATLAGALLDAELVDELIVYMAPLLLGDGARGLAHLPTLTRMADRLEVAWRETRALGRDWRITAIPVKGACAARES